MCDGHIVKLFAETTILAKKNTRKNLIVEEVKTIPMPFYQKGMKK